MRRAYVRKRGAELMFEYSTISRSVRRRSAAMGLPTPEETALVYEKYQRLGENAEATGMAIFERMFHLFPHSRLYFNHISTDDDELVENPKFRSHVRKVVERIGTLVENLKEGRSEENDEMMTGLAQLHKKFDVKSDVTHYVCDTILDVLNLTTGTAERTAWEHVLDYLLKELYNEKLKDFPNYRSLEEMDVTRIKKSWVIIQENDKKFIDILNHEMLCDIKMYEIYFKPLLKTEKSVEELTGFCNHPRNVYNMMDSIISDLENENVIIDKMVEIGERHGRIGVSRKHLNFMTSTIYQAVECSLGPCVFDRKVDGSWEKFLTGFNEVVGLTAVKECMKNK